MKLKIRFPGILLPFRKRLKLKISRGQFWKEPELYFAIGLVLLWLLVFLFTFLKHSTNHK
jgi:Trk-type K+ transport system membrane component